MKTVALLGLLLATGTAALADSIDFRTPDTFAGAHQPQLAVSATGTVYVAFGRDGAVWLTKSADQGQTFTAPTKIATVSGLMVGMRRGPRIAVSDKRIVVTAPGPDLLSFISEDDGATWSQGIRVNDKSEAAREGLQNITALPDGSFYAVWLDSRNGGNQIEGAHLDPGAMAWSDNLTIYTSPDKHVCECCHPSVISDAKGNLFVMFRNYLAGNRDFYLIESTDGGKTFAGAKKLGDGSWKFNACPMDGGNLVATPDGITTVWRRQGDVFLDKPGQPEAKLTSGQQPVVALLNGKPIYAFQENGNVYLGEPGTFEPLTSTQPLSGSMKPKKLQPASFPSLVAAPDGKAVYLAWESPEGAEFAIRH